MFKRDILEELTKWKRKKFRKPLVIRGARQVGKTTAVHLFSDQFDQYIYLNLEKDEEWIIFEQNYPFPDLVTNLFIYAGKRRDGGKTLIFIGCVLIAVGLAVSFFPKIPWLGKLPGDIAIKKENFSFYFPLTTCLLLSLLLSFIFKLWK